MGIDIDYGYDKMGTVMGIRMGITITIMGTTMDPTRARSTS
jgi:hypothetical protein